ncbi:hypothetical protein FOL47_000804 [Perkinsus chesapeaki]|uniref:Tyr recombinase domain-containing protein n=1 Tax=Perkinsus chesapeaki TaxID=330153 RepID=A0A7J6KU48_PERCH|nr:hypothetical protein FOL47_000804 [Perkinsus chesapeaki]
MEDPLTFLGSDSPLSVPIRRYKLTSWNLLATLQPADFRLVSNSLSEVDRASFARLCIRARTCVSLSGLTTFSPTRFDTSPPPVVRTISKQPVYPVRKKRSVGILWQPPQTNVLPPVLYSESSENLDPEIASFLTSGLEWSTRKQYSNVERLYRESLSPSEIAFPLSGNTLCKFIRHLSLANYATSTIESYSRSLRALNKRFGYTLSPAAGFLASTALRAARKRGTSTISQSRAFTAAELERLASYVGSYSVDIKVAAILAIFGLLRVDEVLSLNYEDVSFSGFGEVSCHMKVVIRKSKTDGVGSFEEITPKQGQVVCVGCTSSAAVCNHSLCPFHRVFVFVSSRFPPPTLTKSSPLFQSKDGSRLKYKDFLAGLRQMTGATDIGTHSCRRTGCQLLYQSGCDILSLQEYGRWRSSAVNTYLVGATLSRAHSYSSRILRAIDQ